MADPILLVESVPAETSLGLEETGRTLDVWLDLLRGAKKSVDIATFYFVGKEGTEFDRLVSEIRAAGRRGITVRILTDSAMTATYPTWVAVLAGEPNIATRTIEEFNKRSGVLHAKYMIVDGSETFMGSQNLDWRAVGHIHELGVRVKSKELASRMAGLFEADWQIAGAGTVKDRVELSRQETTPIEIDLPEGGTVRLTAAASPFGLIPAGFAAEEELLVALIDRAQRRVAIQLLIYSPVVEGGYYEVLDSALKRAAGRGVSVRMIVSNWNLREPDLSHLKSLALVPRVEIGISTIPEHSSGFIPFARVEHCKYMVVDKAIAWIGTGNWSRGYFHASRNLALAFEDSSIAETVRRVFDRSWDSAYVEPLDSCRDYEPPLVAGPDE